MSMLVDSLIECVAEASDVDTQDILSISYQWTNQDERYWDLMLPLQLTRYHFYRR